MPVGCQFCTGVIAVGVDPGVVQAGYQESHICMKEAGYVLNHIS